MQNDFEIFNRYFDKVYVLSVTAAVQRREKFKRRFEGLQYEFFYGADKTAFSIEDLIAKGIYSDALTRKNHRYNKIMLPGEIACAWSHKLIYEEIIEKAYNRVLIFEDDATMNGDHIKNAASVLNELPENWEMLMWGWGENEEVTLSAKVKQSVYHIQHRLGFLKWNHRIINNLFAKKFSKHLKQAGFHDFTYSYAVTRSAAAKFIAMQSPVQYTADNLLAHACTKKIVNGFVAWPKVFTHDVPDTETEVASYIRS
ncbi:MAG TPA: glycosyltransferase family 25 protein [Chitinophagaceae bacterium]|nr:glycosyltransferase family 25 protein [Chitinophagaceae bacterium]